MEPEILTEKEFLRQQMEFNKQQLAYLRRLAKTQALIGLWMHLLVMLQVFGIGGLVYVVFFPPAGFPTGSGLYSVAGVIVVFLVFGAIQAFKTAFSAQIRRREIDYHCAQQKAALRAAQVTLDPESTLSVDRYE